MSGLFQQKNGLCALQRVKLEVAQHVTNFLSVSSQNRRAAWEAARRHGTTDDDRFQQFLDLL